MANYDKSGDRLFDKMNENFPKLKNKEQTPPLSPIFRVKNANEAEETNQTICDPPTESSDESEIFPLKQKSLASNERYNQQRLQIRKFIKEEEKRMNENKTFYGLSPALQKEIKLISVAPMCSIYKKMVRLGVI